MGYGQCEFFNPVFGNTLYSLGKELPEGIYLSGVLVHEDIRGMGVGIELTNLRIEWAKKRSHQGIDQKYPDHDETRYIGKNCNLRFRNNK